MIGADQERSFLAFVEEVKSNTVLEPDTTTLVLLSAAMALGCPVCIEHFASLARQSGISQEQIGMVAAAAMAVAAGGVRNQCLEVLGAEKV